MNDSRNQKGFLFVQKAREQIRGFRKINTHWHILFVYLRGNVLRPFLFFFSVYNLLTSTYFYRSHFVCNGYLCFWTLFFYLFTLFLIPLLAERAFILRVVQCRITCHVKFRIKLLFILTTLYDIHILHMKYYIVTTRTFALLKV